MECRPINTRSLIAVLAVSLAATLHAPLNAATLGSQATFSNDFHDVSGTATVLAFDRLRIDDFTFDGGGLDVFFYLGADDTNASFIGGTAVGDQLVGTVFDGSQGPIVIDLPVLGNRSPTTVRSRSGASMFLYRLDLELSSKSRSHRWRVWRCSLWGRVWSRGAGAPVDRLLAEQLRQGCAHVARGLGHGDAGLGERLLLGLGGALAAGTIAPAWPMRRPGGAVAPAMNPAIGFLQCSFAQRGGLLLGAAADLADHDDGLGLRVVVEHLEHVEVRGAVDRIAADADAGALAEAELGESARPPRR